MKIVIVSNIFPPGFIGGYELGALDVARYLSHRGHRVVVLTSDHFTDNSNELNDLVVERSLDCRYFGPEKLRDGADYLEATSINWRNLKRLASMLSREQPDLVLAFNLFGIGPFGFIQYLDALRVPTLLYLMDKFADGRSTESYQKIFGQVTVGRYMRAIGMSDNVLNSVSDVLRNVRDKSIHVPGWVDVPATAKQITTAGVRRFVFSSRIVRYKGVDVILDAARELLSEGVGPFTIDFFGSGRVDELNIRISQLKLGDVARHCGVLAKAEMVEAFGTYDALLFPTWKFEPFGFVACEAAAQGCIPVLTTQAGASEWLIDGVDCIKIEPSVDAVKAAMRRVIYLPDDELVRFRQRTETNARRYFAKNDCMKTIECECMNLASSTKADLSEARLQQHLAAFLVLSEYWKDHSLSSRYPAS